MADIWEKNKMFSSINHMVANTMRAWSKSLGPSYNYFALNHHLPQAFLAHTWGHQWMLQLQDLQRSQNFLRRLWLWRQIMANVWPIRGKKVQLPGLSLVYTPEYLNRQVWTLREIMFSLSPDCFLHSITNFSWSNSY